MEYLVDGDEMQARFKSLEDALQAAKNAPWANGGIYEVPEGFPEGGVFCPEQVLKKIGGGM